jgi:pSer/pThr/pTyr-binding forkhead associated (FHA) protein
MSRVSRRHARIRVADDGEPVLEDAGSSFGTFLDGARATGPTRLHPAGRARLHDEAKASRRGRPQRADRLPKGHRRS